MKMMDLNVSLESVDGDEELLCSVIEAFLEEYPQRLREIDQGLIENNWTNFRRACHTIKGTLRIFGAIEAMDSLRQIESLEDEQCGLNAPPLLSKLRVLLEQLALELRNYVADCARH